MAQENSKSIEVKHSKELTEDGKPKTLGVKIADKIGTKEK
jgi:hypothetical protein